MKPTKSPQAACLLLFAAMSLGACSTDRSQPDAYGNFEADEVIVSAQAAGTLVELTVAEGQRVNAGDTLGRVDGEQLLLQKRQLEATIAALGQKQPDIAAQTGSFARQEAAQREQLASLQRDLARAKQLVQAGAAPARQVEDLQTQLSVLQQQIAVTAQQKRAQQSALSTQRSGLAAETGPLQQQIRQIEDQLSKTYVIAPIGGTVLVTYARQGEVATYGKPVCAIAPLDSLILRAYLPGDKLLNLRPGQRVQVAVDSAEGALAFRQGVVRWVSSQAEFTPKIIQTRDERVNLVYAFKVAVPNDGSLKIGMPAEVFLTDQTPIAKK